MLPPQLGQPPPDVEDATTANAKGRAHLTRLDTTAYDQNYVPDEEIYTGDELDRA